MTHQEERRYRPWRVSWLDGRWMTVVTRAYTDEIACRQLAQRVANDGALDVAVWAVNGDGFVAGRIERIEPVR